MWPEKVMAATLSYFCELVEAEGEENKIGYIFHMDYNVWKQHHFPAASLQTWATPEKQFTSTRSSNEEDTNWPLQEVFKTLHLLPAAGWGAVSLIRQLREREHCCSRS